MKKHWVVDLDSADDAERVATDMISHPLVNSLMSMDERDGDHLDAEQWGAMWSRLAPSDDLYGQASDAAIDWLGDLGYDSESAPSEIQSALMVGFVLGMRNR